VRFVQPLASAFGHTFWWVVGMTVVALVPALLMAARPPGLGSAPEMSAATLVE
jgi:hypothetical protein